MFDLIIFDCDGVLVDSEMIASQVLAGALAEVGLDLSAEDCRNRFTGRSFASVVTEIEEALGSALPENFLAELRKKDVEAFERDLKAIDGVRSVVESQKRPVCVASSGGMVKIRHSLTLTGLIDLFDPHLFSAEQVQTGKPAPDLFIYAATKMRVDRSRCLVIEDSPAGIKGARAAGMTAVGFLGGSHITPGWSDDLLAAGARTTLTSMAELAHLLEHGL